VATRDDVIREIDRLSELPILPQILIRLNKVAEDDNSSVEDFGRVILKDQSLTLQVLRVVNSAFYRQQGRERTTTVSQAVLILGFNGVRRLALGMSVFDTLKSADALPGLQQLWSHSLTTAITTRLLASRTGYYSPEEAFVAGLVHDVGRIVLARCDPELYGRIVAQATTSAQLRDLERQQFGMSHALAGKRLAHRWSLPAQFEEVIGGHHAYETDTIEAGSRLLRLVAAANRFAHALTADEPALEQALAELAAPFGLEIAQAQAIHDAIWREYAELARTFQICGQALAPESESAAGIEAARSEVDRDELLARLQAISAAMVAPDTDARLPGMILDAIMAAVAVDRLFLVVVAEDGGGLACPQWRGCATAAQAEAFRGVPPAGADALARTIRERRPCHVPDPTSAEAAGLLAPELRALLGTGGFATVPLPYRGRAIGALWLDNPLSRRPLGETLREAVGVLANHLALALGAAAGPSPDRAPAEPAVVSH